MTLVASLGAAAARFVLEDPHTSPAAQRLAQAELAYYGQLATRWRGQIAHLRRNLESHRPGAAQTPRPVPLPLN